MTHFLSDASGWVFIAFVIFALIFLKFVKGPLLAKIDARIASIKKELETAENLRIEAQELLAQYQRKHRDAMDEAEEILTQAKEHAKKIREQTEIDMAAVQERREKQLQERLARIEENAVQEIKSYAVDLSVKAAEDIIVKKMDKKAEKKLLDDTVAKLGEYAN